MVSTDNETPPFFKRGLPPAAKACLYLALAFAMLVSDLRMHYLDGLRQALAVITYPLQFAAATPAEYVRKASSYFSDLASLQLENSRLKARDLALSSQVLFTEQLQRENSDLRHLLEMQQRLKIRSTAAEIVFTARDPFSRKVILNKGSQQGIDDGAPVVDQLGVIGQVTRVYPLHAEVTLLSDKDQAIPVVIERSGLRAVMFGTGNGLMELKFLAANAEIKQGDRILTSGLDGIFAPGLPVATVLRITHDGTDSFVRILCRPIGSVERSGAVLVLERMDRRPIPSPGQSAPLAPAQSEHHASVPNQATRTAKPPQASQKPTARPGEH